MMYGNIMFIPCRSRLESHRQKIISEQLKRDDELEKVKFIFNDLTTHALFLTAQNSKGC